MDRIFMASSSGKIGRAKSIRMPGKRKAARRGSVRNVDTPVFLYIEWPV